MTKKSEIDIVPYVEIDGAWTFTDTFVKATYDRIINEGNGYLFNDGGINNRDDFLRVLKSQRTVVYYGFYNRTKLSYVFWFTPLEKKSVMGVWCTFQSTPMRKTVKGLRELLTYLVTKKGRDGEYIIDIVLGFVPITFTKVPKMVKLCGASITKEPIPYLTWDSAKGKSIPAYLDYFTRENCNESI